MSELPRIVDIDTPEGKAEYDRATKDAQGTIPETKMGTLTKAQTDRMLQWAKAQGYTVYTETTHPSQPK
jgi:hypothetical protein